MSYRYEGTDLIFDGWERGISSGPYQVYTPSALGPVTQTGTVDLSYGNIVGIPGEFSVGFPLTASTIAGSPPKSGGQIIQIATELDAGDGGTVVAYFALDSYGQIFISNTIGNAVTWTYQGHIGSNSLSVVGNSGIVWWQGYLLTLRGSAIYYSSNNGVTNTDWTGTVGALLGSGSILYAISSKVADAMYFCNGNGAGSLLLTPGQTFDPTNPATYTFSGGTNPNAVNIPAYDIATCLGELNGQVLIGGALNRIYPWDAQNLSGSGVTSLVGLPLFLGDRYMQRIVVTGSNAYVFTGHPVIHSGRGNIYITNGSTIDIFQKMPDYFVSIGGSVSDINTPYWTFGDAIWHRNQLLFGAIATGNISGSTIADTGGVWGIDINSQAPYRANFATSNTDLVTALTPNDTGTSIAGAGFLVGTAIGNFLNSTTSLSTPARFVTDKVPVGTKFVPKTFEQLEIKTAVALASGETIAITAITDLNPSGILIGTMTSADGMSKVITPVANLQGIQWLQLLGTLTPTNTNPTFVRLREVRLR